MVDIDPLPDTAAAELALGLLDGEDRGQALRRVLASPAFATEVEWWREQFAVLFDLWPDVAAPAHLEARIATSLDGAPIASSAVRRFPWPALAAVTSAIAACLLLFVMVRPAPPVPVSQPIPVAQATSLLVATLGDAKTPIAAIFDPAAGSLRVAAGPIVPDRRVAQLWVIGSDSVPHALGLLSARPTALRPGDVDRPRIAPGATLAISVEPLGGSPTGLPTGPVIATGVVSRV